MPNKYEHKTESVRGNPREITTVNDKTTQNEIFSNFDNTRRDFKHKYGLDPTLTGSNVSNNKIKKNSQDLADQINERGPEAQQEFQNDFKKLKEGYKENFDIKAETQYNRSNIGKYEQQLIEKGALAPEQKVVKEETKTQKLIKNMQATGKELAETLEKRGKTEATHVTQGEYGREQNPDITAKTAEKAPKASAKIKASLKEASQGQSPAQTMSADKAAGKSQNQRS